MPRSRRSRRKSSQTINRLRGAGRTAQGLQLARIASGAGRSEAITWASRTLRVGGPLAALQPRRLSQLHTLPELEPLSSLGTELRWIEALLLPIAPGLNSILSLRGEVEGRLLSGNGEEALLLLDRIETEHGPSLGLIATRLSTLQITRGLEAQKDEYTRLRNSEVVQNVQFFAYWWSVRAEDGSSWRNFRRDFERRLKQWEISDALRAHITFQVLNRVPEEGHEQDLLRASILGAGIDLYEALVATARTALAEQRVSAAALAYTCRVIEEVVNDPRLAKIRFLSGDLSAVAHLAPAPTTTRDAIFGPTATSLPTRSQNVAELFDVPASSLSGSEAGAFAERLLRARADLETPGGDVRGVAELQKLGAMFDHLPVGNWVAARALAPLRTAPAPSSLARSLFMSSASVEPETLIWADAQQRAALEKMPKGLPTGPSWSWAAQLAPDFPNALAPPEEVFSHRAAAELSLIHAQRASDAPAMLVAVRKLEQAAGGPTGLSLKAEIDATLAIDGMAAAVRLCVDRLLTQPAVANWLPLTELAEALNAGSLPASNVDVPILLDFAAKFARSSFGSQRTYAAEDYLTARGATRPAELCKQIDTALATERDRYFLSEVCVPASLRTSTMFNNENELEADRIEQCQWLIDADPEQAERFEEEARELVRARHIKLGIQALQGSKLSVDIASLERWAQRTVAEDYKRYMDLLEQGIFVADQGFRESVYAALEAGSGAQVSLEIPDNEAAALFARFTGALMREFALHPEHGLDAYLSLRIRHGTLSGHLRGPVEREHLVTRRDATGRYLQNDHWTEKLADELDYNTLEIIDDALQSLSRQLDELITKITQDLIQVRREDKPEGLIMTDPSATTIAVMITETLPGLSFEDFFGRCEDIFWGIVASNEAHIAERMAEMKSSAEAIFDRTDDLVRSVAGEGAGSLKDALLRARGSVLVAMDLVQEWLKPPTTPASLILSVEELIRVSLAVIRGFYRGFDPKLSFEIGDLPRLPGMVRLFSDMFFIIFENVLRYSGNPTDPSICIRAWEEGDQILFRVENSVETVTDEDQTRISSAKDRIASGSFRRAVRGEGGTGLPKLAKVIGHGSGGGTLCFDLTEDGSKFIVEFGLRKIDLTEPEGTPE